MDRAKKFINTIFKGIKNIVKLSAKLFNIKNVDAINDTLDMFNDAVQSTLDDLATTKILPTLIFMHWLKLVPRRFGWYYILFTFIFNIFKAAVNVAVNRKVEVC